MARALRLTVGVLSAASKCATVALAGWATHPAVFDTRAASQPSVELAGGRDGGCRPPLG